MGELNAARFTAGTWTREVHCYWCDHLIGTAPRTGQGRTALPGLVRIADDADGVPRYGLRSGAFRKGRQPVRVDPTEGARAEARRQDPEGLSDPNPPLYNDVNGTTTFPRFGAMCANCGRKNMVDIAR